MKACEKKMNKIPCSERTMKKNPSRVGIALCSAHCSWETVSVRFRTKNHPSTFVGRRKQHRQQQNKKLLRSKVVEIKLRPKQRVSGFFALFVGSSQLRTSGERVASLLGAFPKTKTTRYHDCWAKNNKLELHSFLSSFFFPLLTCLVEFSRVDKGCFPYATRDDVGPANVWQQVGERIFLIGFGGMWLSLELNLGSVDWKWVFQQSSLSRARMETHEDGVVFLVMQNLSPREMRKVSVYPRKAFLCVAKIGFENIETVV